ncbi:MAG: aminotransferase class V-fold PLP-dependent enzyme [Bryobacteraceae bacterium]
MTDWKAIRAEVPALAKCVYLNTATYGQTPRCAVQAIDRHLAHRDEKACADFLSWFDDADGVRADLGRLVRCSAEDIAFLPTAASALSLLIGGIDWQRGERVVTLAGEFPNNLYYPAMLGERGVEFVETPWSGFLDALTPGTRLAAISSANYSTGFLPPIETVARECERRGILFYLDGTQSVGALRMDLKMFETSMMAVDCYKWMLTPNGISFVYVHPRVRQWLAPNVIGWRSHEEWRSVDRLHHGIPRLSPKAERYEGGMLPFPQIYAAGAIARWMLEIGPAEIEQRVLGLAAQLCTALRGLGAEVLHEGTPIVAARFEGRDASPLARKLGARGVLVSARHGNLRVSVHFYNDETDLDRFVSTLRAIL